MKLFMLLLGCKPKGRKIEQHDILFCIGGSLKDLVPAILDSWPGAGVIHIDAWREVTEVDGYQVRIASSADLEVTKSTDKLFFLNLGGYKQGEFEEYHYRMLVVASEKAGAVKQAKQTAFYKHTGFKGAGSHIDEKYGIDVDDMYQITDILTQQERDNYVVQLTGAVGTAKDEWHLGYTVLSKIK